MKNDNDLFYTCILFEFIGRERCFSMPDGICYLKWKAEVADLTAQKDRLYREMRKLKEEVAEAETVKKCVEQARQPTEQKKEKTKDRDMML